MTLTTDLQIRTPRAFIPLLANVMLDGTPVRYKGAHGGRGGGKSTFFAGLMVEEAIAPPEHSFNAVSVASGMRCVCLREIQRTLEQSVKQTIVDEILRYDVASYFDIKVPLIRTPGDGIIIFEGMQDHTADSIKSLQRFNRAWVEEGQNFSQRSLDLLRPTIRDEHSQIWASWNPKTKPFKADGIVRGDPIDVFLRGVDKPDDALVVEVNFSDNKFLTDVLRREERYDRLHRQAEDYAHIWKGGYQIRSEARVFKNWIVREFVTPPTAILRFGSDFGFAVDPSVLVRMFLGRWLNDDPKTGVAVADDRGRTLFIDYEAYRVGCDVDHTPALFAGSDTQVPPRWQNPYGDVGIPGSLLWAITCDSANPQMISYLQRHGFPRVKPAVKGPGSVEEGVEFLKAHDIVIHPRCVHTEDEFTFYSFEVDPRTGAILPVLADKKNHVIDACRYALEEVRKSRGFFA